MSEEISFEDIRKGDKDAFQKVFKKYYFGLLRFVWGYVKSKAIAEELVQDLFLKIWEKKDEINIEGSIKTYLFRSARNSSIDWLRHKKVEDEWRKEKQELNKQSKPSDLRKQLHDKWLLKEVKKTISDMPERRREVFMLSRYENMTYKEIAQLLEISVSTVETHMSKALEELRTKFLPLLTTLGGILL